MDLVVQLQFHFFFQCALPISHNLHKCKDKNIQLVQLINHGRVYATAYAN
jgi:hypothetical protein